MEEIKQCVEGIFDRHFNHSIDKGYFEYDRVYPYSNENIAAYLTKRKCTGKNNGLAVLASGDHAFNLVTNGVMNVDTFDINRLTEYYALGLKRAMIMKYSYEEYKDIMRIIEFQKGSNPMFDDTDSSFDFDYYKEDIIEYLVSDLRCDMDSRYRVFWDNIVSKYRDNKERILALADVVLRRSCSTCDSFEFNNYLMNKKNYNILKDSLGKANINFKCTNVSDIPEVFGSNRYDIILLSNTLDYVENWCGGDFKEFISSLDQMSNDNALIFFQYIFDPVSHYIRRGDTYPVIYGSGIIPERLDEYGLELHDENWAMTLQRKIGKRPH